jgi:hypothetical protein
MDGKVDPAAAFADWQAAQAEGRLPAYHYDMDVADWLDATPAERDAALRPGPDPNAQGNAPSDCRPDHHAWRTS